MIISKDKNFVFFHIPKTAGTEIRKWLTKHTTDFDNFWLWDKQGNDKGHLHRHNIHKHIQLPHHKHKYKFAFVRNPYHRVFSAFKEVSWKGPCKHNSFENILINFLKEKRFNKIDVHFRPQVDFIFDSSGCQYVDNIFHYEDLQNSINTISNQLDISPWNSLKNNKHSYYTYFEHYSQSMIDIINIVYAEDFDKFGYFKIPEVISHFRFPSSLNLDYTKTFHDIVKDCTKTQNNIFQNIKHHIIWMRRKHNQNNFIQLKTLLNDKFNDIKYFLPSKWLISIVECFLDFGTTTESIAGSVIVSSFMFEKLLLSNKQFTYSKQDDNPLYGGLWHYNNTSGDMLQNKLKRIRKSLNHEPFILNVFQILFINSIIYDNAGINSSVTNSHEFNKALNILLL